MTELFLYHWLNKKYIFENLKNYMALGPSYKLPNNYMAFCPSYNLPKMKIKIKPRSIYPKILIRRLGYGIGRC